MTHVEETVGARLQGVFAGLPGDVPPEIADRLARICSDLDAMGRIDTDHDAPMLDEHTLRTLLESGVDRPTADYLLAVLGGLPGSALRRYQPDQAPPREVGWYELAQRIAVYDAVPETTFEQLAVRPPGGTAQLVAAVNEAFPSLEPDLLDPAVLPPRIAELLTANGPTGFGVAVVEIDRQLGWWAAVTAALLIPLAMDATGEDARPDTWPLGMFVLAAAIGGWTLTVVESCLLSPQE